MANAVFVVKSRPSALEREAEYNDWYDNIHLGEVCAIAGVTGARRFTPRDGAGDYLAIYDIDADDPAAVVVAISTAAMNGGLRMSDSMSMDPPPDAHLYIEP